MAGDTSPAGPGQPDDQSQCRLLNIPPELRIYVYELSCTNATDQQIELLAASPPPKALVLACRQVYREAGPVYFTAHRQYWTSNYFHLALDFRNPRKAGQNPSFDLTRHMTEVCQRLVNDIQSASNAGWELARNMRITRTSFQSKRATSTFMYMGVWAYQAYASMVDVVRIVPHRGQPGGKMVEYIGPRDGGEKRMPSFPPYISMRDQLLAMISMS